MDDPSCISFSENIDESPNRHVAVLGQAEEVEKPQEGATHFKIYEFNYNEMKAQKSMMSSTDRYRVLKGTGGQPMDVEDATSQQPFVQTDGRMDPVDEDENLFELEIKNLDTNEVFKMQIPIT